MFQVVWLTFVTTTIIFILLLDNNKSHSFIFVSTAVRTVVQQHHQMTKSTGMKDTIMKSDDVIKISTTNHDPSMMTMIGFGSLLSEPSSRLTFPNLQNFRLAFVPNYRRVFGHPTSIFFQRNIVNTTTKEMSSLSVELYNNKDNNNNVIDIEQNSTIAATTTVSSALNDTNYYDVGGLIVSVFEVSSIGMMEDGIPSIEYLEREEEFDIISVPYYELPKMYYDDNTVQLFDNMDNNVHNIRNKLNEIKLQSIQSSILQMGVICTRSTDEKYIKRWGQDRFNNHYVKYGIDTIWNWSEISGLRPCAVYLRHCYLAAMAMGPICFHSFLDDTYLIDRTTTIREYIQQYPEVLDVQPPPDLLSRYSG